MTVITLEFACWWFSISSILSTFIKWYSSARESCIFPLVYSMIYLYQCGKQVLKICFLWHSYKWKILNSEGFFFPEKKEPVIFGETIPYHAGQEKAGALRGESLALGTRTEQGPPCSIGILNLIFQMMKCLKLFQ